MARRTPKRPRDPNQLAKLIVDIATGEVEEPRYDPNVPVAGASGGQAGGPARAAKLTPEQRSEIAKKAAKSRWGKRP